MATRLILALLLLFAVTPVTAMPAGCHGGAVMAVMAPTVPLHAGHDHPAMAEHGCIGCAALADWLAERVAAPLLAPAAPPMAPPARLVVRRGAPPTLRPPREG